MKKVYLHQTRKFGNSVKYNEIIFVDWLYIEITNRFPKLALL